VDPFGEELGMALQDQCFDKSLSSIEFAEQIHSEYGLDGIVESDDIERTTPLAVNPRQDFRESRTDGARPFNNTAIVRDLPCMHLHQNDNDTLLHV
jgi:hypothetical protein